MQLAEVLAACSDEELRRIEHAASVLLRQDCDCCSCRLAKAEEPPRWTLESEDAEVGSTLFQVFGSVCAKGEWAQKREGWTEADWAAAAARAAWQYEQGMALLSDSARERLGPYLEVVREDLARMVAGKLNPIQAGARLSAQIKALEAEGGGVTEGARYSPYEFSRLARTEAAFAYGEEQRAEAQAQGADTSAIDERGGWVPVHPNCMCANEVTEGPDGRLYVTLDPAPSACELCLGLARDVDGAIGL